MAKRQPVQDLSDPDLGCVYPALNRMSGTNKHVQLADSTDKSDDSDGDTGEQPHTRSDKHANSHADRVTDGHTNQ